MVFLQRKGSDLIMIGSYGSGHQTACAKAGVQTAIRVIVHQDEPICKRSRYLNFAIFLHSQSKSHILIGFVRVETSDYLPILAKAGIQTAVGIVADRR